MNVKCVFQDCENFYIGVVNSPTLICYFVLNIYAKCTSQFIINASFAFNLSKLLLDQNRIFVQ